jgi:3-methyladenine DNA glycosylase AlkD
MTDRLASTQARLNFNMAMRTYYRAKLDRADDAISRCFDALLMDDDYVIERATGELLAYYGATAAEIEAAIGIPLDHLRIGPTYRHPAPEQCTSSEAYPEEGNAG